MSDEIIIIGAGGHGRVIADAALKCGIKVAGFIDDNENASVKGYQMLGTLNDINKYAGEYRFVIAIGNNEIRQKIDRENKLRWASVIHPAAVIAADTVIGEGTMVLAGAVVSTGARVGRHCILNTSSITEHDSVVGDYTHVSSGAILCGTVEVGSLNHIGAGSVIRNNVSVCDNVTVGVGAAVVKSITTAGVYTGVPARLLNRL